MRRSPQKSNAESAKHSSLKPSACAASRSKSNLALWFNFRYRRRKGHAVIEQSYCAPALPALRAFEERHYPSAHWARLWGFSVKILREWFRDEYGPGILRQPNIGRRSKRDYTTIMISASAAARVYSKRTAKALIH
jgi:hypothetical protein